MIGTPINPADLLALDGRYAFDLDRDVPLGAEGVGRVEEVGEAVGDLRPGDLVLPLTRGNWCRRRLVERDRLVPLPPGIDPSQAAMLRINPPTARLLLDATEACAGDAIVQNGAGSAVAHWVRLIAARRGVHLIDVVRRPDAALPDAILDGPDLAARASEAAQGRPVRAALDCVAGHATGRLAECTGQGGRVIVFGHLSGDPVSIRSQRLTGGGLIVTGFSLRPAEARLGPDAVQRLFAEIFALLREVPASLPVRAVLPIERAEEAVALARAGGRGRVLLDPAA